MPIKVTGFILLFSGIIAIIFSVYNVFQVLTRQIPPINTFSMSGVSMTLPGQSADSKPTEVIPASALNDISNISTHLLFMTLLISVGFKISTLGTQLLHPFEVNLKSSETHS